MITNTLDPDLIEQIRQEYEDTLEGEFLFFNKLWTLQMIPFDMVSSIADNVMQFGFLGNGELIGRYARVGKVPPVPTGTGTDVYDFSNGVGQVVGDYNGRIVVRMENLYFGWLEKDEYQLVTNYFPGSYSIQ